MPGIVPIGISSGLSVAVGSTTYNVASAANWNLTGVNWSSEGKLLVQGAISGQATDGASPGVMGTPLSGPNSPTTGLAIGVKGDGGPGHSVRQGIGVFGTTSDPTGIGVYGENSAGGLAGSFKGNFQASGNFNCGGNGSFKDDLYCGGNHTCNGTITALVNVVLGSDCAEDFDIVSPTQVEPGMVMVFTDNGDLQVCRESYDRRVAGIISGAGDHKPGLILGRGHSSHPDRLPVALVGRVYCKADAQYGPIQVGDLLTTSPTPGHAMRALDPLKAFGAVIGKALRPLRVGQGLITVLVGLR
jgi:hypothetical protein